jgi:hypothetical protein
MSRARDRADGQDLTAYAPLASPTFTGTTTSAGLRLSGGAIEKNDGTDLLTEAGALDNVTLGSSAVFPSGHVIQRSAMTTYALQTSTAATSASAGLLLFNPTIASLKKANTKVHLQIQLELSHYDNGSGHVGVGRYVGTSTPSYTFGQFTDSGLTGYTDALNAFRNLTSYDTTTFSFNGEQTLTNSVGDSIFYQVTIFTSNAAQSTFVNRSYGTDITYSAKSIGYCQLKEIA